MESLNTAAVGAAAAGVVVDATVEVFLKEKMKTDLMGALLKA